MDLKNIQNEIDNLTKLKTSQEEILRVEKSINSTLLYSTKVRKTYTDAMKAATNSQRDLLDEEKIDFSQPDTGIIVTLPVSGTVGLRD